MLHLLLFLLSFFISLLAVKQAKIFAVKKNVVDYPSSPRKIHTEPKPLLGGLAIISAFIFSCLAYLYFASPNFSIVPLKFYIGIFAGAIVLAIGGFLDDKYCLPAKVSWLFPGFACLIVVLSGIGVGITEISNPFGSPFFIGYKISTIGLQLSLPAVFIWFWLMGMVYTTKFLDGLDGLCAGISLIAGLTLFSLSLTEKINQPITASMAIILSGSILGFLVYNFHPAQIFLGESGSTFLGFMLGVLSVILGGKIATALLVMGIPVLDVAWAIIRRLWYKTSPFKADKSHLHHRLLDLGLSQRQAVVLLYAISAGFGFSAVFLQSMGKLIALVVLFLLMLVLAMGTVLAYKKRFPHIPELFEYEPKNKKNSQ